MRKWTRLSVVEWEAGPVVCREEKELVEGGYFERRWYTYLVWKYLGKLMVSRVFESERFERFVAGLNTYELFVDLWERQGFWEKAA